jgi:DNA/RNA-binding domain of Phe-tRNA-synthetase-like protein
MLVFQYHPHIAAQFPSVVGGVIAARGMKNAPTPDALRKEFQEEQHRVAERLGNTPLSEIPALAAWRQAFRKFGVEPTKYRSASEALLRRLTKKDFIPSINTLVDIGNLVSIRYALPVAVFDTAVISGAVTVHFADGTEQYTELGQSEALHPDPGEVVFSDERKMVIARRWCWRQSATSAATVSTTDAIITVEAHHDGGRVDVEAAVADLLALFGHYAGGSYTHRILDRQALAITV